MPPPAESVLAGDVTAAEAARSAGVTGQAISNWKRRFIEAGCGGLEATSDQQAHREVELRNEIVQLKSALGDSYLQLQAIRRTMRTWAGMSGPARVPVDSRAKDQAHTLVPSRLNGTALV
ncbi:hypothetical protein ACFTY8_17740 [Streptomyces mirabilis]|uniref:hypothetical protein n=1 Tax=Streptomyces mirabilis TaxID=68239 RepID=UPI0036361E25